MDKIILIGGAPTVGKSYLARHLAEEIKLPWISTDTIRDWMREIVTDKEAYPYLFKFAFENYPDPVTFLITKSTEEIIKHENNEAVEVWRGVRSLIKIDYSWKSFIVEGISVIPSLAHELMNEDERVRSVFLVDNDKERIKDIVYTRGVWDEAKNYPDRVKDKEVEWVFAYNQWLREEAKKFNLPIVEIGNRDSYVEEIKRLI